MIELFVERETAEQALRDVLTDEPREAGPTVVEISGHSLRAELTRASPGSARPHRDHMGKAFGDLYGRSGDYTETTAAARIDLS